MSENIHRRVPFRAQIYVSPTHKQTKGISSITEYVKLSILRNWRNKALAVNSFKYRTIKGGGEGGLANRSLSITRGGGGVRRGSKSDHAILEQPLTQV